MTAPATIDLPVTSQEIDSVRRRTVGVLTVLREQTRIALPLKSVRMSARVADRVAHVTVEQSFANPLKEAMEAVYIFPLGAGAAVSDFEMRVGTRVIKGRVEERGEARRQYQQAIQQGKRAALLEQERDDVFTVTVGNVPPGEEIAVKIEYSAKLPYFEDGTTEIRLPMVVPPRYIPGAPVGGEQAGDGVEEDTTQVPDASRITPPRLAPGFDPKVGLSISVELADPDVADLACSQHATKTSFSGAVKIELARIDERLNRDFVLRWRVASGSVKPVFLVHRAEGKGYGVLSIVPPKRDGFLGAARDVIFVLDRSGSMEGVKMASAARACSLLLATLGPRDRFAIQAFDDSVEWFRPNPDRFEPGHCDGRRMYAERTVPGSLFTAADEAGLEAGNKYLRTIDARGGTELDAALEAAIQAADGRDNGAGRIPVAVLITDGQVGNESEILKRLQTKLGDSRIFTVGIDTAVNEAFLKRLAALAGGTSTFVAPGEGLEDALRAVGREIGTPLVVDVQVKDAGAGLDQDSVAPARIPDLFAGRATTAFFTVRKAGKVRVTGRYADGRTFDEVVEAREVALPAVAQLWARTRVADLEDEFRLGTGDNDAIRQRIIDLALRHRLLTRFTAFLAVDESEVVNRSGDPTKLVQPVEAPEGWDMLKNQAAPGSGARSSIPAGKMMCDALSEDECDKAEVPPPPPPMCMPKPSPAKLKREAKAPADASCERAPIPEPTLEELTAIAAALEELQQAFEEARTALEAGRLPGADRLERARAELLKALASSMLAAELPKLQRFLRTEAVDLVAALRSGTPAPASLALVEKHAPALEEAVREAAPRLAGAPKPKGGRKSAWKFWEKSV